MDLGNVSNTLFLTTGFYSYRFPGELYMTIIQTPKFKPMRICYLASSWTEYSYFDSSKSS